MPASYLRGAAGVQIYLGDESAMNFDNTTTTTTPRDQNRPSRASWLPTKMRRFTRLKKCDVDVKNMVDENGGGRFSVDKWRGLLLSVAKTAAMYAEQYNIAAESERVAAMEKKGRRARALANQMSVRNICRARALLRLAALAHQLHVRSPPNDWCMLIAVEEVTRCETVSLVFAATRLDVQPLTEVVALLRSVFPDDVDNIIQVKHPWPDMVDTELFTALTECPVDEEKKALVDTVSGLFRSVPLTEIGAENKEVRLFQTLGQNERISEDFEPRNASIDADNAVMVVAKDVPILRPVAVRSYTTLPFVENLTKEESGSLSLVKDGSEQVDRVDSGSADSANTASGPTPVVQDSVIVPVTEIIVKKDNDVGDVGVDAQVRDDSIVPVTEIHAKKDVENEPVPVPEDGKDDPIIVPVTEILAGKVESDVVSVPEEVKEDSAIVPVAEVLDSKKVEANVVSAPKEVKEESMIVHNTEVPASKNADADTNSVSKDEKGDTSIVPITEITASTKSDAIEEGGLEEDAIVAATVVTDVAVQGLTTTKKEACTAGDEGKSANSDEEVKGHYVGLTPRSDGTTAADIVKSASLQKVSTLAESSDSKVTKKESGAENKPRIATMRTSFDRAMRSSVRAKNRFSIDFLRRSLDTTDTVGSSVTADESDDMVQQKSTLEKKNTGVEKDERKGVHHFVNRVRRARVSNEKNGEEDVKFGRRSMADLPKMQVPKATAGYLKKTFGFMRKKRSSGNNGFAASRSMGDITAFTRRYVTKRRSVVEPEIRINSIDPMKRLSRAQLLTCYAGVSDARPDGENAWILTFNDIENVKKLKLDHVMLTETFGNAVQTQILGS